MDLSRILKGNYGQRRRAVGGRWTNIATMHLAQPTGSEEGAPTSTVTVRTSYAPWPRNITAPATLSPATPKVLIRITTGVLGVKSVVYTLCGTPKTVSGTDFYVEAQVFLDEQGAIAAPGTVFTDVTAYFSEGEGQDVQPTVWVDNDFVNDAGGTELVSAFQTLYIGPGRLREAIGYNDSANPTWLMFFDWPPPGTSALVAPTNGGKPFLVIPIPGAPVSPGVDPYFSFDAIESKKDFSYGLAFATSSTGNVFTFDDTGLVHVEAELYQGDETNRFLNP